VIAREKQRKQLGDGAIADRETDAKNASVDGPLVRVSTCLTANGILHCDKPTALMPV
jgi:hypothetical protein